MSKPLAEGKERITVTLPKRIIERLDEEARRKGVTKSVLLTFMTDQMYPEAPEYANKETDAELDGLLKDLGMKRG